MAQPATLYFDILRDGDVVRSDRSDATAIKIGSHPKSHLHVEDSEVSRVHAVIEKGADGVSVIDLGSGRGTYVNGEKVSKRQLAHGDVIKLGNTEIRVWFRDEQAARAAEAATARATDPKTQRARDEVLYARRFLAKPATTDGSVEIAMLYHDHVMAEEIFQPPETVTLGPEPTDTFCVDHSSLGGGSFALIETGGGEPVLNIAPGMVGEIYVGRERRVLDAGGAKGIPLTQDTRARVAVGDLVFFVHRSTRPALALPLQRSQLTGLGYVLFSGLLHAILLALIMFLPPGMGSLSMDGFGADDRFVQFMIEEVEPEPEPEPEVEDSDEGEDEEQQLEEGDEGRAGDEREEDTNDRMAIEGDLEPNQDVELARMEAREAVQDRGALAVLNQAGPTSLFGGQANGYDAVMAIGSVSGPDIGASYGTRGLGAYGGGLSGGGRQLAGIGSGPIALRGRSSGQDSNLGRNMRSVRDRETRQPTVSIGTPSIQGQLDREIIQRVIREHRREIRACYEAELQRNPDLEGRVLVGFLIERTGRVAAANVGETSLNNSSVENCVTRRVRQWRFPEPRGGGSVTVNYPFVFSPGG